MDTETLQVRGPVQAGERCGTLRWLTEHSDCELIQRKRIAADDTFYDSEDASSRNRICEILSGVARMVKVARDGRRQIVALKFPTDLVGAVRSNEHDIRVEAISPIELLCMSSDGFAKRLDECPEVRLSLLRQSLSDLDAARDTLLLLGRKRAPEKVASLLVILADRLGELPGAVHYYNDGQGVRFRLPLSRAEIGHFLGLTTETVSRQLTILKGVGLIRLELSKVIAIPDIVRLRYTAAMD